MERDAKNARPVRGSTEGALTAALEEDEDVDSDPVIEEAIQSLHRVQATTRKRATDITQLAIRKMTPPPFKV